MTKTTISEYLKAMPGRMWNFTLDVNPATVAEIRQLMAGDGSGRVQR